MILVKRTIKIIGEARARNAAERKKARVNNRRDKIAIFKNCGPFTDCTCEIILLII